VRALKEKKVIWYAPDQDFGLKSSVFAPFMGVPAATLTMTSRLAKRTGAPVMPWYAERLPGTQGYLLTLAPALANFPSGDDEQDATAINNAISEHIRKVPEQYLWGHRRFKTRPQGEPQIYPIRSDRIYRRYRGLLALLTLPAIAYSLWQAYQFRDKQYLLERLGLKTPSGIKNSVWIHCASVGEVNAAASLIELLTQRHPEHSILLTTSTPSGAMTARNKLPAQVHIHYLPIDWRFAVRRFINRIQPGCALILETELWPHLFAECYRHGTPIIIVNGRLSKRTTRLPIWLRAIPCRAIEYLYAVLARSEEDKQNYLSLGSIPEEDIKVLGNIKFSARPTRQITPFTCQHPYVLAASTRDGEERLLVESWLPIEQNTALLIIVPRHPRRLSQILRDLSAYRAHIAVRSREESITAQTRIYIADTFGELPQFIAGSRFVIMGGSFRPFGGQNILEVGWAGKAVIFGPHMDNFRDEAGQFLQHAAGIQVADLSDLSGEIKTLLADSAKTERMGNNALALMEQSAHIAEDYYTEITRLCTAFQAGSASA